MAYQVVTVGSMVAGKPCFGCFTRLVEALFGSGLGAVWERFGSGLDGLAAYNAVKAQSQAHAAILIVGSHANHPLYFQSL
jgi:hypothetical protein